MFKEYGELSTQLYELTKPIGYSINGDIEYYYEQLKHIKGNILEAGVGTGRMLIPLLQKGLRLDGVDLSHEMLEQCALNLDASQLSADLYEQNLASLAINQTYDAIIMPTGSFCLLPKEIIRAVLNGFHRHLGPNGKLIFDIELPAGFTLGEVSTSTHPIDDHSGILFTSMSEDMDWHAQKTSYIHKYELLTDGIVEKNEVSNFVLYWYGIDELTLLLENIGFEAISHEIGYGTDCNSTLVTFSSQKKSD